MSEYHVEIKAVIVKTLTVEADSVEAAEKIAHETFDAGCSFDENYSQDTIYIEDAETGKEIER